MTQQTSRANAHSIGYWLVLVAIPISATIIAYYAYHLHVTHWSPIARAMDLNRAAWVSAFVERRLTPPNGGPREGYWGSRLGRKTPHPTLGWREPTLESNGYFSFDGRGLQKVSTRKALGTVLIVGGSTAAGAYASSTQKTYFSVLSNALKTRGLPVDIVIAASGAWKSVQEAEAIRLYTPELRPLVIIMLSGLNDLTNGATADDLYWSQRPNDGELYSTPDSHNGHFESRVAGYLRNVRVAAGVARRWEARLIVVLQPSLVERANPTPLEKKLLERALPSFGSKSDFLSSYAAMRQWLTMYAKSSGFQFLDANTDFQALSATTFTDMWHFPDPGHEILGLAMVDVVEAAIRAKLAE